MKNHLQNLIETITKKLENNPGCLSKNKDDWELTREMELMDKIQENQDKKGISLLLEKFINDLSIDDTEDNLLNWKSDLYKENKQNINERMINDFKKIWLDNIERGSNS